VIASVCNMQTTLRVILLFAFAVAPFVIGLNFPEAKSYKWFPGGPVFFYFLTGMFWCCLFTYTWVRASLMAQKWPLGLLPLVLFAFGFPAFWIWLGIAMTVQSIRGGAIP